jgi:methanogenic corrinoid protein MtbC1
VDNEAFDLDVDAFRESDARLRTLKSLLPAQDVYNLAREVLRRVNHDARRVRPAVAAPGPDETIALSRAMISENPDEAIEMVRSLRRDGVALDVLLLVHLAQVARQLGEWWDNDELPSWRVTQGTSRIYAILRTLRRERVTYPITHQAPILFTAVPGDDHTLGVQMATDVFRSKGWDVQLVLDQDHNDLVGALERSGSRIIGVSASSIMHATSLARLLIALRISIPELLVLVSGRIVVDEREMVALMEPDSIALDVPGALAEIEKLAARLAPPV